MKKKLMTIVEQENALGSHTIIINNARYQKCFLNSLDKILKSFFVEEELYFGFYRKDGLNLTLKRQKELSTEIPIFFQKNGDIQNLNKYLSIARMNYNDDVCSFIPSIFDYYLETTVFNAKVKWEVFKEYHSNYQKHRFEEIVLNGFAEILFCYFDSGDFLICFNPKIYNPVEVRNVIDKSFSV